MIKIGIVNNDVGGVKVDLSSNQMNEGSHIEKSQGGGDATRVASVL